MENIVKDEPVLEIGNEYLLIKDGLQLLGDTIKMVRKRFYSVLAIRGENEIKPEPLLQLTTIMGNQLQEIKVRINNHIKDLQYIIDDCQL